MRDLFTPFDSENIIDIDGCAVPIDPDFRIMCRYGTAVRKGDKKSFASVRSSFSLRDCRRV